MSNAEEFETVDVSELEEEDALSDNDVMPELDDNPVQGEMVSPASCAPRSSRGFEDSYRGRVPSSEQL
jgi:hypothetical protein